MTKNQYRLNKFGTKLLKNDRPLFDWANDSDDIADLLNEQEEEITSLKFTNMELEDANARLEEQIKELEKN